MSKRYTFFRTPSGKPYKGNDGRHAPTNLLADIGNKAQLSPGGTLQWETIQWDGFFIERFQTALHSSLMVIGPDDEELNEHDVASIAWTSLIEVVRRKPGQPVNPSELLSNADKLAAEFFRKPLDQYVLISSLSVADLPAKSIRIGGCTVSDLVTRGIKFPLPSVLRDYGNTSAFTNHLKATRYRPVKMMTHGRSIHEAVEKGLNALNMLRGLWSLLATQGSWTIRFGGNQRKPIGVIHTGPLHTLHYPDGRVVDDGLYWYDADYIEDQPLFAKPDQWPRIEERRKWALRRIKKFGYRRDLEDLLIRYAGALDQSNPSVAFLQMWSILERITNTVGSNYDETIKRTIWIYSAASQPIAKDMLEALRYRRNQYVHSGAAAQQADQIAYMIKSFVDPHLAKLIGNPFKLRTLDEYGEFLSMPKDISTLQDRRRKIGMALRALQTTKPKK